MVNLKAFERCPRLAEIRVSYRRRRQPSTMGMRTPELRSSKEVEAYLRTIWSKGTLELVEDFVLVCLNSSFEPLGWVRIFRGGIDFAAVDARVVFAIALQTAAAAIVVAHNHPSGSLEPSREDIAVTKRLKAAGELLHCRLIEHMILTRDSAVSLADRGYL